VTSIKDLYACHLGALWLFIDCRMYQIDVHKPALSGLSLLLFWLTYSQNSPAF